MHKPIQYPTLTTRQQQLFALLLEEHVSTASAVGSNRLAQLTGMAYSSATIRNDLAKVEELRLVVQPHTSAGRIPTELGYAYYVDMLMQTATLTRQHKRAILKALNESRSGDLEEMLSRVSIALSRASSLISVILSPRFEDSILHKVDLVRLSTDKVLIILTLRTGFVKSMVLELQVELNDADLALTVQFLNERLSGVKLSELKSEIEERLLPLTERINSRLVDLVLDSTYQLFDAKSVDLHVGETRHVLVHPEFSDIDLMRGVFELIDDRMQVINLVNRGLHSPSEGIRIAIGRELDSEHLHGCSVVTTSYLLGESVGNISVIGPTRMNYSWLVSLINFTSSAIHRRLAG
ncbi:heat-inducible transcriptional repressor HrcA [bacterium]|nr:heat-inducible transcriptional repressor HrcA [bacterium]